MAFASFKRYKIYLMDTRFLESFTVVAEYGSLAAAARKLGLTPAAVAQRIKALEVEIGTALIARVGRGVHPTEAGQAILEESRNILRSVRDLRAVCAADRPVGDVRIGAINTAMTGLFPSALAELLKAAPDLDIFLLPGPSTELYRKVTEGELDAAVLVRPPFAFPKSCGWRPLRSEPLVVLASAASGSNCAHDLLRNEPFLRYDRSNWGGRPADRYLRHAGIRPRERLELDSLEAIAVMVERGLGVSLVPDWAPPWPTGGGLRKVPLPDGAPAREIGIIWHRASPRARFINTVADSLARVGAARV